MHYMVHYPNWIQRVGPLVHAWCMRFEGKQTYIKNLAHRMNCFKNVCKTLAIDHQYSVCYSGNYPLIDKPTCGPEIRKSLVMLKYSSILPHSENDALLGLQKLEWHTPLGNY
uniref:Uncharacterized protein n=1 Tax=Amphimedon queenslandica TaxID=400682 RepID=A0A1X7UP93_AMPQE